MANNPAKIFIRNDVLKILRRVTGFDLNKIFKSEFNVKLRNSEIKLLTSKQLEKVSPYILLSLFTKNKFLIF